MRPKDQARYRNDFSKQIDHAIKECSRKNGVTDLETVYSYVKKHCRILLRGVMLADEQVRVLIQKRLKRCEVSPADAQAAMMRNAVQPEFNFFEMDQFRGVPQRISYPVGPNKIEYVEYSLFEIVYKRRKGMDNKVPSKFDDGKIGWRKFAPRAQEIVRTRAAESLR
jgi:hypothetical protein